MGSKYTTTGITGYNTSPPPDDGTVSEANKVKYSTHKSKLTDPIKDQVAAIDIKLQAMADVGPNPQSTAYTTVASDHQKVLEVTGTTTITLLDVASAPTGYMVTIKNAGSNTVTVDATATELLDGATATQTLAPQESGTYQLNNAATGYNSTNKNFDGRDPSVDGAKLDGIEALADVTDTANVTAAGALMDSEVDADIKTLVLPANTTISTYGASLVDDADAGTARTTLGLGTVATESTVPVLKGGTGVTTSTGTGSTVLSASPALTGTPTAPTATPGTNTTQIATTAFVTASTGALIHIETKSAAGGVASLDFSTGIDSTYDTYIFYLTNVSPNSSSLSFYIRFSTDGGSTYISTANYGYAGTSGLGQITPCTSVNSVAAEGGINGHIILNGPSNATSKQTLITNLSWYGVAAFQHTADMGYYNVAGDVDAVRFIHQSGNLQNGTISLYGVAK